jgi:tetratricopeptide (TPR) repeat protein
MGLADVLMMQGRAAEAIENYLFAIQNSKDVVVLLRSNTQAATNYLLLGKPELAMARMDALSKFSVPPNVPDSFRFGSQASEAEALLMLGNIDQAQAMYSDIIAQSQKSAGSKGFTQLGINGLAKVQAARGNFGQAIALQEQAIQALDARLPLGSRRTYDIQLATMLVDAKQYPRAERILRGYLDARENIKKLGPHYLALAQEQLARIYFASGKRNEAAALMSKAKDGIELCLGQDSAAFARILAFEQAVIGND